MNMKVKIKIKNHNDMLIAIIKVFLDLKNRRKKLLFNTKNKQRYKKLGKLGA